MTSGRGRRASTAHAGNERPAATNADLAAGASAAAAVAAMLDARSIAIVGASARPGSFGERMVAEVTRDGGDRRVHLVNPRYDSIAGRTCRPSLDDLDEPVDLVLLGVGDAALADQMAAAARTGARSAVVFGSAHAPGLRDHLRDIAERAGMAVCGGGCMGFVNVATGLRAIGYVEAEQLAAGPIALVTHSGSVFSAMLRTRRALGYTVAVSSGQELVTGTADYLDYVLDHTGSRVIGLVLETVRDASRVRAALRRAAERDIPVVLLPVGGSPLGAQMVAAHSGAVAGADAMWQALCAETGLLRVGDLNEFTDTLELLSLVGRRKRTGGIATVHDSGAERTLVADLADELGVPFAAIGSPTRAALAAVMDEGLAATNPLDLWGTGADTRALFGTCLRLMTEDPAVGVTALAVDLVPEYDGDASYPDAVLDVAAATDAPLVVLTNLPSAIDEAAAARLRAAGVPVLEGTRSGLVAVRHLLSARPDVAAEPVVDADRRAHWQTRLACGEPLSGAESFALISAYGIPTVAVRSAEDEAGVLAGAAEIGYPVVLKIEGVAHKSEVGGVVLGIAGPEQLKLAYAEMAGRLGARVVVSATAPAGVEISVGMVRDAQLGPMVVVAAGGTLMELLADRAVALPPVSPDRARSMLRGLRVHRLLAGWRGGPAADEESLVRAIVGMAALAHELGELLAAADVNPIIAGPAGAMAVDVLAISRAPVVR